MDVKVVSELKKESKELKTVCIEKLDEFFSKDEKVTLLDADLMGSLGSFGLAKKYGKRVIDCGVMEAQEIGAASGLSRLGFKPFVHTFTVFASRRCLDQIFVSSLYQNNPIAIIATDAGIQAVHNGGTHMSFEDLGIIRGLTNTIVIEPTDQNVLKAVLDEVYNNFTKTYWIRITRKLVYKIYENGSKFKIGKANLVKKGKDVLIVAMGLMVKEAMVASEMLEKEGITCTILDMFTLKPIDKEAIIEHAKDVKLVISAENHNIINGLGSAVSEVLSENIPKKLVRIGVDNKFGQVGTLEYLQEEYGLTAQNIYRKIKENL